MCVAGNASAHPGAACLEQAVSGAGKQETRRTPGSAAGCDKPASSGRRKPSRWCETTRTERIGSRKAPDRSARQRAREWTPGRVDGGEFEIPEEDGRSDSTRATGQAPKVSQGPRVRTDPALREEGRPARRHRKTSRTRAVTRKVEEGAGESNDPLRCGRGRRHGDFNVSVSSHAPGPGEHHGSAPR
jgi:hypothetical protein